MLFKSTVKPLKIETSLSIASQVSVVTSDRPEHLDCYCDFVTDGNLTQSQDEAMLITINQYRFLEMLHVYLPIHVVFILDSRVSHLYAKEIEMGGYTWADRKIVFMCNTKYFRDDLKIYEHLEADIFELEYYNSTKQRADDPYDFNDVGKISPDYHIIRNVTGKRKEESPFNRYIIKYNIRNVEQERQRLVDIYGEDKLDEGIEKDLL